MKRKLPVLIAIILALAIALAACQSQNQPVVPGGNQTDPLPSHSQNADPTQDTTLPNDPANTDTQPEESKYITMDEAIAIALKDAGFKDTDVTGLHAELERDDGITIYDVDFYKDGKEYDYEIHAETGEILKPAKKAETANSTATTTAKPTASTSKQLTKDQAISKALSHAGLKKSQVSKLRAEQDKDDGVTLYEVDFETADWEYEYEINAKTGKIIKAEKDRND